MFIYNIFFLLFILDIVIFKLPLLI